MRNPATARTPPSDTRTALLAAAAKEFETVGYEATHTNKIAARAGFAPQTFYRHFEDKLAIFLIVYREWVDTETEFLDQARDMEHAASILIAHHRRWKQFRRSVRVLAIREPAVRAVWATAKKDRVVRVREWLPQLAAAPHERIAGGLLLIERMADAIVEGELEDLGVPADRGVAILADTMRRVWRRDVPAQKRKPARKPVPRPRASRPPQRRTKR
jgi:AcrR family transcriptional regulator